MREPRVAAGVSIVGQKSVGALPADEPSRGRRLAGDVEREPRRGAAHRIGLERARGVRRGRCGGSGRGHQHDSRKSA